MRLLILYASTSGSSRIVVESLARDFEPAEVESYNIAYLDQELVLAGRRLILLVTPTYGIGDWHYAWEEKGAQVLSALPPGAHVAILALGDSRGHKNSFAGGIGKLAALARSKGAVLTGSVPATEYSFVASPAGKTARFPA